jgi:cell division protein FtsI/penicillin-binding protein 2
MKTPATFLNYHQTLLLLIRIFYLQVINDSFKLKSDNNAIKIKYDYPERGYILIDMESFSVKSSIIWHHGDS